MVLKER